MSEDGAALERALNISLDYGPVYLATGARGATRGTTRRRMHLFADCDYIATHALESERYETVADVPRSRWIGSIGPLPPRVCNDCDQRHRHG